MRLGSSFFVKIFLGFWLVTLAILASWMLSAEYFATYPHESARPVPPRGGPHGFVLRTIYKLQNMRPQALANEIARIERKHEVYICWMQVAAIFPGARCPTGFCRPRIN